MKFPVALPYLQRSICSFLEGLSQRLLVSLMALLCSGLLVYLFLQPSVERGHAISFNLSGLNNNFEISASMGMAVTLKPGRYRARLLDVNSSYLLISDKNVRLVRSDSGSLDQTAIGVLWHLPKPMQEVHVEFETLGMARFNVEALTQAQASSVKMTPWVIASLFAGGLALICLYASVLSMLGRERVFVLLTIWIFGMLAVGAITAGYDLIWFGAMTDPRIESSIKQFLVAAWVTSIPALFYEVFKPQVNSSIMVWVLRVCQLFGVVCCVLAPFIPGGVFMPLLWIGSLLSLAVQSIALIYILFRKPTRIAVTYALGWCAQFGAIGYELATKLGYAQTSVTPILVPAGLIATFFMAVAVSEILQRQRLEKGQALRVAERARSRLSHMFKSSPAGLMVFHKTGFMLQANPKSRELLNLSESDSFELKDLLAKATPAKMSTTTTHAITEGARVSQVNEYSLSLGSPAGVRHLQIRLDRQAEGTQVVITDNTAEFSLNALLRKQLITDTLTGLLNRQAIQDELLHLFESRMDLTRAVLIAVDVNNFTDINRHYGQEAGDSVLKELATRLKNIYVNHNIFRLNADLFGILLHAAPDSGSCALDQLQGFLTDMPFYVGRRSVNAMVSVAMISLSLFKEANDVLDNLKYFVGQVRAIGSGAKWFGVEDPSVQKWLALQQYCSIIDEGDWRRQIVMFAQPLVGLQADRGHRFELLLRVKDGERVLAPGDFIAAGELLGVMPDIDLFVIEKALMWIDCYPGALAYVTANLSGASLANSEFLEQLRELLKRFPRQAKLLCLEVTESVAIKDLVGAAKFFDTLETFQVKLALDDFGQGYTNFKYVTTLPAHVIKLDGSLVQDLETDLKRCSVVKCLTEMAHGLGIICVAEWVESKATADLLGSMGVDLAQGWYFARPMPLDYWIKNEFPVYRPEIIDAPDVGKARDRKTLLQAV